MDNEEGKVEAPNLGFTPWGSADLPMDEVSEDRLALGPRGGVLHGPWADNGQREAEPTADGQVARTATSWSEPKQRSLMAVCTTHREEGACKKSLACTSTARAGVSMITGNRHVYVTPSQHVLPRRPATVSGTPRSDTFVRGRFLAATGNEHTGDRFGVDPALANDSAGDKKARASKVRTFDNIPNMQSTVDTVVFGRDVDNSGDTKFDEEFISQFVGRAGLPSWYRSQD